MMNYSDWLRATGRTRGRESSNEYLRYKGREAWQETGPARVTYQTEKQQERRSAAARKGWETRRRKAQEEQQARQEKRRAAARKGWETRRRKAQEREERRARRSAAARKGWQTRIENRAGYDSMINEFAPSEKYTTDGGYNSDESTHNIESTIGGLLAMGYTRQQLGAAYNRMVELRDVVPHAWVFYYKGENRRLLDDWLDRFVSQVTNGKFDDFEDVQNDASGFNLYDEDMSKEKSAFDEMLETASYVTERHEDEGGIAEMPDNGQNEELPFY